MDQNFPIEKSVEILRDHLYFSVFKLTSFKKLKSTRSSHFVSFDDELKYRNFFNDFGPLNISCVYKYCCRMSKLLQTFKGRKRIVHYTNHDPNRKTNAAYLIGAFAVIYLKHDPADVYRILMLNEPYKQFVDALQRTSIHTIRIHDCLTALAKAAQYHLFDFEDFNSIEYDQWDQLDKGNMNWILPRKFLAFLGPTDNKIGIGHKPAFYLEYFLQHDIKTVIRLNDKCYDAGVFTQMGIEHFDLFFDDGSVPSMDILQNFLRITETAPAAIAVHCKAGLGRTGTLIGAYLMKHYLFGAREAVAWIRICRPGSVTGAQQFFLEEHQNWLWSVGAEYRARHYGEEMRMPHHKYGIYSKLWPLERSRLIMEARRKLPLMGELTGRTIGKMNDPKYLKNVTRLLSAVCAFDEEQFNKVGKVLTTVPRHRL